MKKLTYFTALAGSLLFATSCVDLDQEPQSFITEEDYIAKMDQAALEMQFQRCIMICGMAIMVSTAVSSGFRSVQMKLLTVRLKQVTPWLIMKSFVPISQP